MSLNSFESTYTNPKKFEVNQTEAKVFECSYSNPKVFVVNQIAVVTELDGFPSGLALTVIAYDQIDLDWSSTSTNQDGYRIYYSTDGVNFVELDTSVGLSYSATGLTENTDYYFYVVAYLGVDESVPTDTEMETTSTIPLDGVPSNLVLTVDSDSAISGTFTIGSTNQDGHYAYYSTDNVNFIKAINAAAVMTGVDNSFQITGLTAGTLYYVKTVAYRGLIESTASNTDSKLTHYTQLMTTWHPSLINAGTSRASIAVLGDSISDGLLTTDADVNAYPRVLATSLKALYGDGGEGFMTAYHNYDPTGAPHDHRWTYAGTWVRDYANSKTGTGACASRIYCLGTGRTASITFTGDSIGISTLINHANGGYLEVRVDTVLKTTIDLSGDKVSANGHWGQITTISALGDGSHTLLLTTADNPAVAGDYAWIEGVRPLIGIAGIVIDQFGKGWMRADWLGSINESNPATAFFESLKSCVDRLDTDLFIVALGINDYIAQIVLNTYESRLTTIVQRCKAVADTIILATPQPNSALTIPYSDYITRMQTVATANSCLFVDSRDVFGTGYKSEWMVDANHPNDLGHEAIGDLIFNKIK